MKLSFLLVAIVFVLVPASHLCAQGNQIIGFSFDIDNNILSLPTKIVVFKRGSGEERALSTAELAEWRERNNVPNSPWKDYYISPQKGSFKFYRDLGDGINHFLEDIKRGMKEGGWKGPVFDAFVEAMKTERTAHKTTLITARGHDPKTILEGLEYLRDRGFINHVPLLENIWPVSQPNFEGQFNQAFQKNPPPGTADEPSERKAAVMEELLDKINKVKLTKEAPLVLSPNGGRRGRYHTWGFSDDDFKNFREAKKVLQEGVDRGRWGRVKIVLYFTGTEHGSQQPHAIVLRKKQEPRPLLPQEEKEWKEILKLRRAKLARTSAHNCEGVSAGSGMFQGAPNLFNPI